jgi:hypothetical protein
MIACIITIFSLQFISSLTITANDISNLRYNSLISAQCKARCLYEFRNHHHHQQQRSVPAIFNNGKTKRLLVRSKKKEMKWVREKFFIYNWHSRLVFDHLVTLSPACITCWEKDMCRWTFPARLRKHACYVDLFVWLNFS